MVRILAITPPGSMERVLSDLRGSIFRRWGAVSALALPPLIPLAAWRAGLPETVAAAKLAGFARAATFELDRYERYQGYHYLAVRSPALEEILPLAAAAAREGAGDPAAEGPLPCYPGFFLAGPDLDVETRVLELTVGLPAERTFRSYGLSIVGIESTSPAERWWDLVSWEELVHVPVKSSGRAAPGSAAKV